MCISAFIAYGKWFLQFPGSDTGLEIGSSKPWPAVKPYPPTSASPPPLGWRTLMPQGLMKEAISLI